MQKREGESQKEAERKSMCMQESNCVCECARMYAYGEGRRGVCINLCECMYRIEKCMYLLFLLMTSCSTIS